MAFFQKLKDDWASVTIIVGMLTMGILGFNYTMAQAKDAARTEVEVRVNKAMIDGAKEAAKKAVEEQLPTIAEAAADAAVQKYAKQQEAKKPKPKPSP
jgi:hypothetical protein